MRSEKQHKHDEKFPASSYGLWFADAGHIIYTLYGSCQYRFASAIHSESQMEQRRNPKKI